MKPPDIDANESAAHRIDLRLYGLAVLSVAVALGVALFLQHLNFRDSGAPLLLFAVAIASWYGGGGPATLAVVLSIMGFYWYFVEPVRTIYIYRSEIPYFIIFVAFALLMSWFSTIRRRAEAVLREQANLLNLTHDTVLVMDMEGVIRYWNRGAGERYGWTAEEAVGRVVHDLLKTVFPTPIDQIKAEVTRTGRWEGELVHSKKDGTQVVVASRWSLERDKQGAPVAILETNNDITERKRAEEALSRLNRELRALSDCNQTLLRATEEQSLLEEICRIVCEEAGYRPVWVGYVEHDEAKSVRPVAWAGADEAYLATARISWSEETEHGRGPTGMAIRSGKASYVQDFATDARVAPWREVLLQGGFRSAIALPLKDEHGNAFGSLTMHSDRPNAFTPDEIRLLEELAGDLAFGIVSLRSRAARERAEQEVALLSFALDNVREAAYLIDDSGRYHYVNVEGCRVLGYPRAELLGMSVPDIDPQFPVERWSDHWRELKIQRSLNFESRHRTRDGRTFPVEVSANYFEYGGRAYNLGLVRDITERKRAEEERERLRQLESDLAHINRVGMMGELATSVAHEVNQPLTGIVSNGSACIRLLTGDTPNVEEALEALRDIVRDGKRAGELIARIRAMTKRATAPKERLDLNEVIREVLGLVGDEAKKWGVVMRTAFAETQAPVTGDRVQLQQVVLNLAMNAIEAMSSVSGRPRELVIRTRNVDGGQVEVTVEDSGVGLDPNTISKIFEPFYTTKSSGMGMGLSICRSIVQNHGGRLWATANNGPGTSFQFNLPTSDVWRDKPVAEVRSS